MITPVSPAQPVLKRDLVKFILEHAAAFEWSIQGFGMLRTYIEHPDIRLHIWDSRYRVRDVTMMHTHPWHFDSEIIAGRVENTRYTKAGDAGFGTLFREQEIVCGVGGHETEVWRDVYLHVCEKETFVEGDRYRQFANEIHASHPVDGSVTIIRRTFQEDTERAYVYVPAGLDWVSAEPRPATSEEISDIVSASLTAWFS